MAKVGNTEGLCCQHNCKLQITLGAMPKLCKTFYYKHLPEFPRSTFDLEKFCKYLNLENGFGRKSFLLCFYQVFLPRHFGLIFQHLILDFFHGYFATENGSYSQVTAMERITSCHHIPRKEHLWEKNVRIKKSDDVFLLH